MNYETICNLVKLIRDGLMDKATIGNVTLYKVKDIVRIDIKFDK